ncbi:MAG: hypothetical protein HYS52_00280 [Candidatus Wildermuthbacteria bacterium]|nr:hypothetical protein [Candidatus Wildermuthbacteria bacterium]
MKKEIAMKTIGVQLKLALAVLVVAVVALGAVSVWALDERSDLRAELAVSQGDVAELKTELAASDHQSAINYGALTRERILNAALLEAFWQARAGNGQPIIGRVWGKDLVAFQIYTEDPWESALRNATVFTRPILLEQRARDNLFQYTGVLVTFSEDFNARFPDPDPEIREQPKQLFHIFCSGQPDCAR